jgi:pimeloyl-ACP methyl ester carboxylesterase
MPHFSRDGHSIHYEIHGEGPPVILLHGICVSFAGNFASFGWIERLTGQGLQVIGMDFLGHGKSDKSHAPAAYGATQLGNDVVLLMDRLGLPSASLLGFSLGSGIALHLLHSFPERFNRSVLIATGDGLIGVPPYVMAEVAPKLAEALDHPEFPAHLPKHVSAYWNFATKVGGDRRASAAAARAEYPPATPDQLAKVASPVLVVSGECDPVLGQGPLLSKALPHGQYLEIPGADHFMLAANEQAQIAVATFLGATSGAWAA